MKREGWNARFQQLVAQNEHACRSWKALTEVGINPLTLSGLLAASCECRDNPVSELIETWRSGALAEAEKAMRLARRIEEDRDGLMEIGATLPDAFSEQLTGVSSDLRASAMEIRSLFSKHKANTNFFLAWLVSSVHQQTGSPRYKEVSILLDYAYVAYGEDMPLKGEEALRKTYSRYMKENPFAELLSPEGKRKMLFFGLILVLFELLKSANFFQPGASPPVPILPH